MIDWMAHYIATFLAWARVVREDAALTLLFWRSLRARAEPSAIDRAAFIGASMVAVTAGLVAKGAETCENLASHRVDPRVSAQIDARSAPNPTDFGGVLLSCSVWRRKPTR